MKIKIDFSDRRIGFGFVLHMDRLFAIFLPFITINFDWYSYHERMN